MQNPILATWQDTASALSDLVTAAALLVGGAFAYFRFARGRIFARRAEISLDATPLDPPLSGLHVQLSVENTGASQLSLSDVRYLETFAITQDDWPHDTNVVWGAPIIRTRVLRDHDWLESAETVGERLLVPLPPDDRGTPFVAYLVRARITAVESRWRRAPTGWAAQVVVLPRGVSGGRDELADPGGAAGRQPPSRPGSGR